jgi:hypothetical protein
LDSHLKDVHGFHTGTSLSRIVIPSLVEVIRGGDFSDCLSLNEVIFESDAHLREIDGFP